MNVGYIGLGAMGRPLARRLLGAYPLCVSDINAAALAELEKAGAAVARSGAELARRCDVVLLCLPRTADVRQVVFGPGGLAEGLRPGTIVIDQTSGVPEETREIARELAQRGVAMLDAPVAGGVPAAEDGRITIMVSGPDEAYTKAAPVLRAISANVVRCGERLGDGQAIKLVNNVMNAECRLATLEVVAMGRKLGLSLKTLTEVINSGEACNRISQVVLPSIMEGKASTDFALALMVKDVNQAIALGMAVGAPMPIASIARGLLQIGVNTLGEGARLEDVIGLIESMAGTRLIDDAGAMTATRPAIPPAGESEHTGNGPIAQLIESTLGACNRLITYEAVAMGVKNGLKLEDIARVVNKSSGWSRAFEHILPVLASGGRTADLRLERLAKDLVRASQLGMSCGAPMLIANAVRSMVEAGANELGGEANVDELARFAEARAGIRFADA